MLLIILISQIYLSSLAKTEVYFSLYDDPEAIIIENINKAEIFIDFQSFFNHGNSDWQWIDGKVILQKNWD